MYTRDSDIYEACFYVTLSFEYRSAADRARNLFREKDLVAKQCETGGQLIDSSRSVAIRAIYYFIPRTSESSRNHTLFGINW